MMKLGALLVRLGLITPAQLEESLRAQVVYGARLGTNIVEVTNIDLDVLAQALGRLHRVSAALQEHFEQADPELQAKLGRFVAARWECVPLARLADDSDRIAIALAEPLPPMGMDEVAAALGTTADRLVVGLAPELRIRYHLETVYGIEREPRFLRVRGGLPELPDPPAPSPDSEVDIPVYRDSGEFELPAETSELSDQGLVGIVRERAPTSDSEKIERRKFVRTITPKQLESVGEPAVEPVMALGRLAIKRVMVGAGAVELGDPETNPSGRAAATLADAAREIRQCRDRDKAGDLVIAALDSFGGSSIDAAALFVMRGNVAMGWKGLSRTAGLDIEALAVPLDEPGCLATLLATSAALQLDLDNDIASVSPLDRRLHQAFSPDSPRYLLCAPLMMGEHVICVVYAQSSRDPGLAMEVVTAIAAAASTAFTRLIRAAQR